MKKQWYFPKYYYNKINKILTNYNWLGGDFIAEKGIGNHNPSKDYVDEAISSIDYDSFATKEYVQDEEDTERLPD